MAVAAAPTAPAAAPALDEGLATPAAFTPFSPPEPAGLARPSEESGPPAVGAPVPALPSLAAPEAPGALPQRVYIHYPRSSEAAATAARDALLGAGVPQVDIVPVRLTIDQSNIRYYHDADRAAADALSALMAPTLPGGPPVARDFTDYPTPPASGKVEVWLSGTSDGPRTAASAPSARVSSPSVPRTDAGALRSNPAVTTPLVLQPPTAPVPPANQAQEVERILIERAVQQLLQQNRARP
jgi:hypothetical protein